MTAAHTPGPWHWPNDSSELCPVDPDPDRSAVSSILHADGGYGFLGRANSETLAELDANRRLIAAAPELLDALRAAYSDIQRLPDHTIDMLGRIEAAICKATGATQ